MQDFAASGVGTLGRDWWRRCQPQIGYALASGLLVGILIGGGLAVRQVQPGTLMLWSKYKVAQAASVVGLSSVRLSWPGERGDDPLSVDELLKKPGLDTWAEPVSKKLEHAATPSLIGGFLAFLAAMLWSASRAVSDGTPGGAWDPVVDAHMSSQDAVAQPLFVTLPPIPPPEEGPRPFLQETPAAPDPPPEIQAPPEPPRVVAEKPLPVTLPPIPPPEARPFPTHEETPGGPGTPAGRPGTSYDAYWGLTGLPFENVPDPKFYFPTSMHEEALHRLLYGVQTRKGAVMLTGEVGCGKTLLSRELSLHLAGEQYDVALIANPSFGTEDFLTEVLYQLGIEPATTKVHLLHLLNERLLDNYKRGKQTVMVIDEAQTIRDDQIFEELRLLLNFQLNDRFLLTLVLMGQPELNDRVMAMKQFAQRISIKYHLGFFSEQQTIEYIRFRLKAVNCTREIFSADALEIIFKQSGGIPRNINTLCDLCLLIGSMDRAARVDRRIVERAAAERGQLGLF